MKIKKLQLQNFKRFTDLTIDLSEEGNSHKLVLLIGANGSGKSAVFDAFEVASRKGDSKGQNMYYQKGTIPSSIKIELQDNSPVMTNSIGQFFEFGRPIDSNNTPILINSPIFPENAFYGRSSVRYLSRITKTSIGNGKDIASNFDKPNFYIDPDNRFENDIDDLITAIVHKIFQGIYKNDDEKIDEVKIFLKRINDSIIRIFNDKKAINLRFLEVQTPHDGIPCKIIFQKGDSIFNYDLLSSGEKEVVNILFNLFVRTPHYQDSIYFFDELDTHLHTSLQYNLLKEITENWIPENCQLWTATHSLGFIQYAKSSDDGVIIDFDSLDFDNPITLKPISTPEVFDIAVPKEALDILFKDKKKVFCENQNALLFNTIGFSDSVFLGETDKNSVCLRVKNDTDIYGIIDRDFLSDDERKQLQEIYSNLKILAYYCFENYLYHPENIKEIVPDFDVEKYKMIILDSKNQKKANIIYGLQNARNSYIFFKQNIISAKSYQDVLSDLESDDFETFYKVFSMKNNGDLSGNPNLSERDLVKTTWFKAKITEILG
jgi:AAA15 family ATPase/GTPase